MSDRPFPLADYTEPEALDQLLGATEAVTVQFEYDGIDVLIVGSGVSITVRCNPKRVSNQNCRANSCGGCRFRAAVDLYSSLVVVGGFRDGARSDASNRRAVLSRVAATLGVGLAGYLDRGEQSVERPDSTGVECSTDATKRTDRPRFGYRRRAAKLGSVSAAVADTPERKQLGPSDTESLPETCAMLFVYDDVGERTFVMPEMSFGIDIVFADDEGVITEVHHAPEPGPDEDGLEHTSPGRGQYVLETVCEWTADPDVEEGTSCGSLGRIGEGSPV
ncbi:DUF192 domain-containing protein [Natrialba swarupiae]|nr:DUF192 domain-containing protein [Natrialba swarupiae]